ncbi:MAG: CAP domain-containing protein [Akkermansiaceae bacterium]|nr:CAP domain-containing protein [Akkermansiaceae bacterium]NNM30293.1 CAP domain-containing protein [Akkermansiaceae bacterium]
MKLILTLICAAGLISCSGYEQVATKTMEGPAGGAGAAAPDPEVASIEHEILVGINAYRGSIGKGDMKRHRGLDELARQHSEFMMLNAGKFNVEGKRISHYGFGARAAQARNVHNMGSLAENVIAGWGLEGSMSDYFIQGWIDSPNHLHNIKGGWGHTGIGVAIGPDGAVYGTQLFGLKNVSHHEKFGLPDTW